MASVWACPGDPTDPGDPGDLALRTRRKRCQGKHFSNIPKNYEKFNLFVSFCFTFCYSIWGPAHRAWAPKAPSLSRHLEELKLDRDSGNCELQWMAPWAFPQRRSKPARSVPVLRIGCCSLQSALWCLCNVLWAHHTLTAAFLQEFPDHDQASREKNPSNLH